MFCPECSSLMFPEGDEWVCRKCDFRKPKDASKKQIIVEKAEDKEMMIVEGDAKTLPTAKVRCSECGHNEAFWVLRQTRAADEPETRIYRCTKCNHTWREY